MRGSVKGGLVNQKTSGFTSRKDALCNYRAQNRLLISTIPVTKPEGRRVRKRNKSQEMLRSLQSYHMCTLPSESRTAADLWLRSYQSSCWFVGTSPRSHRKPAGRPFIGENANIGDTVWAWLLLTPPHRRPRTTVHLVFAAFLSLYNSCHFELLQLQFMCDSCVDNVQTFYNH